MNILVINSGSSSIKYKLFAMPQEKLLSGGLIEHIGEKGSPIRNHRQGLGQILKKIEKISCVGHRIVHGGEKFKYPTLINARVIKYIKSYFRFAPLHNPANLQGVLACKELLPRTAQVAVFDTAFYQTLPPAHFIYALPYSYYEKLGIRKYGFHGTSHQYVAEEAARILGKPLNRLRLITCHLGNGCSITAIKNGKSIETSMGFTPLEGLVMGTRCGDIDPAIVTYLMQKEDLSIKKVEEILNRQSGLIGISGISNDMRTLEKAAVRGHQQARLAIEIFIYRIRKYISSYLGIMAGADAVIFTAGIGEHQARIRKMICQGLFKHLKGPPEILIIPTNEELMIARQTYALVREKKNA